MSAAVLLACRRGPSWCGTWWNDSAETRAGRDDHEASCGLYRAQAFDPATIREMEQHAAMREFLDRLGSASLMQDDAGGWYAQPAGSPS